MAYSVIGKGKMIARLRRHQRVRKHVFGTAERPRLVVRRSNRHMRAQLVDDNVGHTLVSASTLESGLSGNKTEQAHKVGELIAERAKASGITAVVFDRGGNKYHGRVAAVAEGARKNGLNL